MPNILIIAIDPGTVDSGVCLARDGQLVETKTLHVPKSWKAMDRTLGMMEKIEDYIYGAWGWPGDLSQQYEIHIPYESPGTFHGEHGDGRPIASLLQLVAVLEYWARKKPVKIFPYPVGDIKEGIAGWHSASKQEVEAIMRQEYNLHEMQVSNHEWDAISIFTYHLRQLAVEAAIMQEGPRGGKS